MEIGNILIGNHKHSYGKKSQTFLWEITNIRIGNHKHSYGKSQTFLWEITNIPEISAGEIRADFPSVTQLSHQNSLPYDGLSHWSSASKRVQSVSDIPETSAVRYNAIILY